QTPAPWVRIPPPPPRTPRHFCVFLAPNSASQHLVYSTLGFWLLSAQTRLLIPFLGELAIEVRLSVWRQLHPTCQHISYELAHGSLNLLIGDLHFSHNSSYKWVRACRRKDIEGNIEFALFATRRVVKDSNCILICRKGSVI